MPRFPERPLLPRQVSRRVIRPTNSALLEQITKQRLSRFIRGFHSDDVYEMRFAPHTPHTPSRALTRSPLPSLTRALTPFLNHAYHSLTRLHLYFNDLTHPHTSHLTTHTSTRLTSHTTTHLTPQTSHYTCLAPHNIALSFPRCSCRFYHGSAAELATAQASAASVAGSAVMNAAAAAALGQPFGRGLTHIPCPSWRLSTAGT
jgi:hypothetical protein